MLNVMGECMSDVFNNLLSSAEFREEYVVAETQARLSQLLEEKGISRAELSRRLDVTRARVTQIFSDEAQNFTLRLLVRSYLALGEEPVVVSRTEYETLKNQSTAANTKSVPSAGAEYGMAETLVASLLRASIGDTGIESERPQRRANGAKDWVTGGSNVIPFGLRSNG